MWVRFLRPYDWRPNWRTTIVFSIGPRLVRRVCGEEAIKAGAAIEMTRDEVDGRRGIDE